MFEQIGIHHHSFEYVYPIILSNRYVLKSNQIDVGLIMQIDKQMKYSEILGHILVKRHHAEHHQTGDAAASCLHSACIRMQRLMTAYLDV